MLPYLDQRISGIPKTLYLSEFEWMITWSLNLKKYFPVCVEKIIEADEAVNLLGIDQRRHTDIFLLFKNQKVFQEYPNSAGKLILHLLIKKHISMWDWTYLKEIIQQLAIFGCDHSCVSQLIEAALDVGFKEAEELRVALKLTI